MLRSLGVPNALGLARTWRRVVYWPALIGLAGSLLDCTAGAGPAVRIQPGALADTTGAVFEESDVDRPVTPVSFQKPDYPADLQQRDICGWADIRYIVGIDGRAEPASIMVVRATHRPFGESRVSAIAQSIFRPAVRRGHTVRQRVAQRISFTVDPAPGHTAWTAATQRALSLPLHAVTHVVILNRMVQYSQTHFDASFGALSDPTRRGVLEQLGRADASITALAERFHMTLTGMKKHVGVLEQAGLVTTEKVGRVRTCRLGLRGLQEEAAWIERYRQLWSARFDELDNVVEVLTRKERVDGRKKRK